MSSDATSTGDQASEAVPVDAGRLAVRRSDDPTGMDRIEFFSDAVFAIAMTLLVVSLVIPVSTRPPTLDDAMDGLSNGLFAFALSFVVIGQFWISHHRLFRLIRRYDLALLWLNLFHLLGICFLPFPTELLGCYFGDDRAGLLYGATLTATSVFGAGIWFYSRARHLTGRIERDVERATTFRAIATPIAFAAGTALAPLSMQVAVMVWALLLPIARAVVTVTARAREAS
jgi:TMEM175 potassium channel family protein